MRLRTQGRLWQTERAQVARDDFVAGAAVYDAGPRTSVHAESTSPQSRPDWRQRRPIVFHHTQRAHEFPPSSHHLAEELDVAGRILKC